jgi:hypothetical protein
MLYVCVRLSLPSISCSYNVKDPWFKICLIYGTVKQQLNFRGQMPFCADHSGNAFLGMKCLRSVVGSNSTQGMDVCLRFVCVCVR